MIKGLMNQRHSQNKSHKNVHLSMIVENLTYDKNGTMISVNGSVKKQ